MLLSASVGVDVIFDRAEKRLDRFQILQDPIPTIDYTAHHLNSLKTSYLQRSRQKPIEPRRS